LDDAPTPILLISLLVLLIVIGFSSGTEVAMLSVNRYRIRNRAQKGERSAKLLEKLLAKPDDWLGANLVILAAASVFASAVATILAQRTGHPYAVPIVGAVLTIVMIVFCELAPKIYAATHPEPVALSSSYIYRALVMIARPALWVTNRLAYGFLRIFGVVRTMRTDQALSTEELRTVVAEAGPLIPARHRQMLLSILDLGSVTVNDIMIPRQEIASIDVDENWEDLLDKLRQTPHTRLPVYDTELDNCLGILHMKRVAHELARGTLTRDRLIEIARNREPYYVPEGTPLNVQLSNFQRNRRRLAFVVNEYGDIEGLVTLEDILEEIVGDIRDEHDVVVQGVRPLPDGSVNVDGSVPVRDLNRAMDWRLPDEEATTIAGLVIHEAQTIPDTGQVFTFYGYRFQVLRKSRNRITALKITPLPRASVAGE
jgi:Mg2+/Co2+ transporter CorB